MCFIIYILGLFFFFKQKTAYEMRISDWSSDVCSSDLDRDGEVPGRDDADHAHRLAGDVGFEAGTRHGQLLALDAQRLAGEELEDIAGAAGFAHAFGQGDRKRGVYGKSVSVRVDIGGRRIIKTKTYTNQTKKTHS